VDDRTKTALHWPDAIHAQFRRADIRQVGYVPDAGHSRLIELCVKDPNIHDVVLTTEEEGVGLAAGAGASESVVPACGATPGTRADGSQVYKGIAYAAPPLGDLRSRPAAAVARWVGTRRSDSRAGAGRDRLRR